MIDLTNLANVRSYLGIDVTNTGSDAELTRLIGTVSALIRNLVNRDITTEAYVDKLNGTGSDSIMVPNYPITSISSIVISGVTIAVANYTYDKGQIILLNGLTFPKGRLNIVVSYSAGYATIPYDIEQVCIEIVAKKFKQRDRIGLSSKGLAGETTSFDLQDMRSEVRSLLSSYMKVIPV